MKIDRELQRQMLEKLRDSYPLELNPDDLPGADDVYERFNGNLFYLKEHGLIEGAESEEVGARELLLVRITAKGIDFLEADGGVDAILRTVIVRFDPDQLRKILAAKVEQMDIPPKEKTPLLEKLKAMPAEVLQSVLIKLAEKGLECGPDALALIQKMVS